MLSRSNQKQISISAAAILILVAGSGGSFLLAPGIYPLLFGLFIEMGPHVIILAVAAIAGLSTYGKNRLFLAVIVLSLGAYVPYVWYDLFLSDYYFAKEYIELNELDTLPGTVKTSFRDLPEEVAQKILDNNVPSSFVEYTDKYQSFDQNGGDGYVVQEQLKNSWNRAWSKSHDTFIVQRVNSGSKDKPITKIFTTKYNLKNGFYNNDLGYVLQKKRLFSKILMGDLRVVFNQKSQNWVIVVPVKDLQWHNGLLNTWTWSGNFFIENDEIKYLSKKDIKDSPYAKLNVVPDDFVNQVKNLYRFKKAKNFWGVQFGQDLDYESSQQEADNTLTTIGEKIPLFMEYEGRGKSVPVTLLVGGDGVFEIKTEEQFSPDIFSDKVDAILATDNRMIVQRTGQSSTNITAWEKSKFLPVLRDGQVWYVYFISSNADATALKGLIGVNSSNNNVANGNAIDSNDPNQVVYFKNIEEVEAWIGGKDIVVTPKSSSSPIEPGQPSVPEGSVITREEFQELKEQNQKILTNQEEIKEALKELQQNNSQ